MRRLRENLLAPVLRPSYTNIRSPTSFLPSLFHFLSLFLPPSCFRLLFPFASLSLTPPLSLSLLLSLSFSHSSPLPLLPSLSLPPRFAFSLSHVFLLLLLLSILLPLPFSFSPLLPLLPSVFLFLPVFIHSFPPLYHSLTPPPQFCLL